MHASLGIHRSGQSHAGAHLTAIVEKGERLINLHMKVFLLYNFDFAVVLKFIELCTQSSATYGAPLCIGHSSFSKSLNAMQHR